jgi:hypothetical protein
MWRRDESSFFQDNWKPALANARNLYEETVLLKKAVITRQPERDWKSLRIEASVKER